MLSQPLDNSRFYECLHTGHSFYKMLAYNLPVYGRLHIITLLRLRCETQIARAPTRTERGGQQPSDETHRSNTTTLPTPASMFCNER